MSASITPHGFADKWRGVHQKESAVSREHFIDLCRMLDQPTPTEADPTGHEYAFERKVKKTTGGKGYADVWKRGHFAWEYKGKRANLDTAYTQLLLYREDLENPPLLTVCDLERFEIHTNFTGTPKKIHRFTLDDLEDKPSTFELLHAAFADPEKLNPKYERELVTLEATAKIGELAQRLLARGYGSEEVARFTMRMVFALFAEDVQLLPKRLVTEILERLDNIRLQDALLDGEHETEWPEVDFIIGNPPFLGGKRVRSELGDAYVDTLFKVYGGRVRRESDLVCYWVEKARTHIERGKAKRAGLIATNSIRGGANRRVLESIKETGNLFMAWADEPWILAGAAVRVSLIGFDDGSETARTLNGHPAAVINPDLTGRTDLSKAKALEENKGISFMGTTKLGAFEITGEVARSWLELPNPNGRSNADVVKPWVNGMDITRQPRDMWIVDFGLMPEHEAEGFIVPYEYAKEQVKPERLKNNRVSYREKWWQHGEARPKLRRALEGLDSYLVTPRVVSTVSL